MTVTGTSDDSTRAHIDLMRAVVRLYRNATESRGRDLFVCTIQEWRFLQDLARTFGWHPTGTTYELPMGSRIIDAARRNYEPGLVADVKEVTAEDAIAWARALQRAKQSPHFDVLAQTLIPQTEDEPRSTKDIASWLAEFIEYAFGGPFAFALEPLP